MAKVEAPFTDEQVDRLFEWQGGLIKQDTPDGGILIIPTHPFTCSGHNECNRSEQPNEGVLIPTKDGWVCPCGAYKQSWCHDFMVSEELNPKTKKALKLLESTMAMLDLSRIKGFQRWSSLIKPTMTEPWMDIEYAFCNIACTIVAYWLRKEHYIDVYVAPTGPGHGNYVGRVVFLGPMGKGDLANYTTGEFEIVYLATLTDALNLLPPGAQDNDGSTAPTEP